MKRIGLVGAGGYDWWSEPSRRPFFDRVTPAGYEIIPFNPEYGTHAVECRIDEAYNAPHILKQIMKATEEGVDAIVIDCFGDPGLEPGREITTVPVVGVRRAALHLALTLGTRFLVISVAGLPTERWMEHAIRADGLGPWCAGIIALTLPVLELARRPADALKEIKAICKHAIENKGADVVVFGCTGLSAEIDSKAVSKEFGVPILDPLEVGIKTAALLVECGLSHSKVAYPMPTRKPMTEDPVLKGVFDQVLRP